MIQRKKSNTICLDLLDFQEREQEILFLDQQDDEIRFLEELDFQGLKIFFLNFEDFDEPEQNELNLIFEIYFEILSQKKLQEEAISMTQDQRKKKKKRKLLILKKPIRFLFLI